ncbi:tyrosine-type recombinase/integrase [Dictyobacter arantiisoli]|uniref:Site-specific integrase n=1 Tax=Dictyobacter arantiisoli TaxID=2014874 RepID=A0A5A5TLF9_9CHLR|nr:tyrosine-type recombinase/integrase [Dictyobacter arantiisoli]GCF11814.1 site-specific integrase [Dictyobacter arantiisoli]
MGKRANGEGTVYQRKDGRWVATITIEQGKRKYLYFKTQKEAIKAARETNNLKDQGLLLTGEDQTIELFLRTWLEDTAQPRLRERTYIRYRGLIENHIIPAIGKVKLQKLMPQHLQRLYNEKRKEGYAPQTIKHIHRVLHRAFHDALRWSLITHNVCDAVDAPRVPRHEMQVLNVEQAQKLLQIAREDPFEAVYVLALTTGMRQGELLGLKWEDISLDGGKLQVRRTIARVGKLGFITNEPKTPRSRRSIYLADLAIEALKRHRAHQYELRLSAGPAWEDQGWVFCNQIGRPVEAGNLMRRSFKPLLKKADVPDIRFHDLRHSAATLLLSMDVHPKIVQELLGHSNISMTLDTYSHVLPSLQEQAVTRLNTLFSATTPGTGTK